MNFLIKLIFTLFSRTWNMLPLKMRWGIGGFLGWLWIDVLRLRRFTVLKNITRVFPDWSKEQKLQLMRSSMQYMCYNFIEFSLLRYRRDEYFNKTTFLGLEHYEKAVAQNKGVLFLTLHMGNGDVATSLLSKKGMGVHLISKKFKNKAINELWFSEREKNGTVFIDPHNPRNAFEIFAALKKNKSVVFVMDQFMGKPFGIESTFFGIKTGTAYGLALFALKTKAPVLPIFTYRDKDLNIFIEFQKEIEIEQKFEDRDLQVASMVEQYNRSLEDIIRKHPEQWMWVHKRWKTW